jgi:hypothetical protein
MKKTLSFAALFLFAFGVFTAHQFGVFQDVSTAQQGASLMHINDGDEVADQEESGDFSVAISEIRQGQEPQSIEVVVEYTGQPNHVIVGHSQDPLAVFSGNPETFVRYEIGNQNNGSLLVPIPLPAVCGGVYQVVAMGHYGDLEVDQEDFLYTVHTAVVEYDLPWNNCPISAAFVTVLESASEATDPQRKKINGDDPNLHPPGRPQDPLGFFRFPQLNTLSFRVHQRSVDARFSFTHGFLNNSLMPVTHSVVIIGPGNREVVETGTPYSSDKEDLLRNVLIDYGSRIQRRRELFENRSGVETLSQFSEQFVVMAPEIEQPSIQSAQAIQLQRSRELSANAVVIFQGENNLTQDHVALGYLLASEELSFDPEKKLFVGELALNGELLESEEGSTGGFVSERMKVVSHIGSLPVKDFTSEGEYAFNVSTRSIGFSGLSPQQKVFTETEGVYSLSMRGLACSTQYRVFVRVNQNLSHNREMDEGVFKYDGAIGGESKDIVSDTLTFITPSCDVRPVASTSVQARVDNLINMNKDAEAIALQEQYRHLFPDLDVSGDLRVRESIRSVNADVQNTMVQRLDEVRSGLNQAKESGEQATREYLSVIKQALEYIQTLLKDLFL